MLKILKENTELTQSDSLNFQHSVSNKQITLLDRLKKSAELHASRTILEIENRTYSYQEIYQTSLRWTSAIESHLTARGQAIALLCEKSFAAYCGIWTALQLHTPFVPLSCKFPLDRIASMLNQSRANIIIADKACAKYLPKLLPLLNIRPLVLLPENSRYDFPISNLAKVLDSQMLLKANPSASCWPPNLCSNVYMLFTSGSTGIPKGVPIQERNLISFLDENQKRYQITKEDRLSQTFDLTFDLSMFDLFMAWTQGACVCVFSSSDLLAPQHIINSKKITVWFSVPSVVMLLMKRNQLSEVQMPTLRLSLFCGEPLTVRLAKYWQQSAINSKLENLYGPTELTIYCSAFECKSDYLAVQSEEKVLPLGFMISGNKFVILDPDGRKVGPGQRGELCVNGDQMFAGYLQKENSEHAFINLIDEKGLYETFYRTGDFVSYCESEGLIFHGRRDRQVKVSGYRIELGEIEKVIRSCSGVITAGVQAHINEEKEDSGVILNAFIYGSNINEDLLMQEISAKLPQYMIPKKINILGQLPVNSNGKVDYFKMNTAIREEA